MISPGSVNRGFRRSIPNYLNFYLSVLFFSLWIITIAARLIYLPFYPYGVTYRFEGFLGDVLDKWIMFVGFYPLRVFDVCLALWLFITMLDLFFCRIRLKGSLIRFKWLTGILLISVTVALVLMACLYSTGLEINDSGTFTTLLLGFWFLLAILILQFDREVLGARLLRVKWFSGIVQIGVAVLIVKLAGLSLFGIVFEDIEAITTLLHISMFHVPFVIAAGAMQVFIYQRIGIEEHDASCL